MADRPSASPTRSGPTRTCVGCRMRAAKNDLVRVVARTGQAGDQTDDLSVAEAWLDVDGTHPGRGAYLHPALSCLDLAERRRALPRALRLSGGLDTERLREQMATLLSSDLPGSSRNRSKAGRDGDEHAMSAQQ